MLIMIKRLLQDVVENRLFSGKALLLLGARQVGKTTLLNDLVSKSNECLWLNGDELDVQKMFENASVDGLKKQFGQNKIVVIDEAQRIKDIGLRMKLITDQIKDVQLIATGSSAFDLANNVNEPLTNVSTFVCGNGSTSRTYNGKTALAPTSCVWLLS